jgi:hypothetical protein
MINSDYYIINGSARDASIYRHGKKIINLHKKCKTSTLISENMKEETFWDLTGKDYSNCKWFLAIYNNNIIGTCCVTHLNSHTAELKNLFCEDVPNLYKSLIKNARKYSNNMMLVSFVNDPNEQNKLKNIGASESVVNGIKCLSFPNNKQISKCNGVNFFTIEK